MKKILFIPLIILSLIIILFFIRLINPKELDDVHPDMICMEEYLEKSDILWVIPKLNNKSISENKSWCEYILSLNKTIGLHGVYHEFKEFEISRNQEYLEEGIKIFEECFNFKPEMFKPPRLAISTENKRLIKDNGMKLKGNLNQLTHKVYHCSDSGRFSNKFIDLF